MRKSKFILALFGAALVGALTTTAVAPLFAQSSQAPTRIVTTASGKVISETVPKELTLAGSDLALRVDRSEKGRVVGTLMANVNGNWIPVQLSEFNTLAH